MAPKELKLLGLICDQEDDNDRLKVALDFAKEAYTVGKERGMYEQECLEIGQLTGYDPSIPTFEEWLNE